MQQNLSNFMNAVRMSRRKSIAEFSKEIGISKSEMQLILKGTCNIRIDTLKYIAQKLEVDPAILLLSDYSKSQYEFAILLLQTIDKFSKLPDNKREEAAELFNRLILLSIC
ncbi:MAG: helix-turn-helix domain-containing protein [Anaerovoracaceae bacterium]